MMAGIFGTIGEKLGLKGGGDKMQYLLAGALVLVIIIAIIAIITNIMDDTKKGGPMRDQHYWDLETQSEIVLKPEEFKVSEMGHGMMDPMGPMMGMGLMKNPKTGERTLLRMELCPSCKQWYLPTMYEGLTLDDFDEETGRLLNGGEMNPMMLMGPGQEKKCPKCGIDIIQFYRDKRKKK